MLASRARASRPRPRTRSSCCYAVQDKVWVDAPDGEPWEIYTVLEDIEMTAAAPRSTGPTAVLRQRRSRPRAAAEVACRPRSAAPLRRQSAPGFLVAVVVGSGIFAQRLSPNDIGLQLLENSIATGAGLIALILAFGSISGAHFNPVVTLAEPLARRHLDNRETRRVRHRAGRRAAASGVVVANLMFDLPAVDALHPRSFVRRRVARARSSRRSACCS